MLNDTKIILKKFIKKYFQTNKRFVYSIDFDDILFVQIIISIFVYKLSWYKFIINK